MEEIENMKKNIEESNNIISKLNKDIDNKMNKNILLKIENNSLFSINKNINKEFTNKNHNINIQSNNNKTNFKNRLDMIKTLYDLINDDKIGEDINNIIKKNNIYNKSNNDINNINE